MRDFQLKKADGTLVGCFHTDLGCAYQRPAWVSEYQIENGPRITSEYTKAEAKLGEKTRWQKDVETLAAHGYEVVEVS